MDKLTIIAWKYTIVGYCCAKMNNNIDRQVKKKRTNSSIFQSPQPATGQIRREILSPVAEKNSFKCLSCPGKAQIHFCSVPCRSNFYEKWRLNTPYIYNKQGQRQPCGKCCIQRYDRDASNEVLEKHNNTKIVPTWTWGFT